MLTFFDKKAKASLRNSKHILQQCYLPSQFLNGFAQIPTIVGAPVPVSPPYDYANEKDLSYVELIANINELFRVDLTQIAWLQDRISYMKQCNAVQNR